MTGRQRGAGVPSLVPASSQGKPSTADSQGRQGPAGDAQTGRQRPVSLRRLALPLPGHPLCQASPWLPSYLCSEAISLVEAGAGGGDLDLPASKQPHPSHSLFLLPWLFWYPG